MSQSVLGSMIVKVVGENSEFDKAIDNSEAKANSFQNTIAKLAGAAGLAMLSRAIVNAGKSALESAGQMQMYESSFITMLGSATKAKAFMSDIVAMAARTPFQTTDLADASKTLLQFGVAAEDMLPTLQMLGDISQGNNQRFNALALVFGQMRSAGRLMGQDLLQMINAGFNPLQVISEKTGESMANLKDKMSKGAISAEVVTQAFKDAASAGGKFFGGMELASKTLPGLLSTLSDNVSIMGRSFTDELMPAAMDTVKWLSDMANKITALDPAIKSFVVVLGAGIVVATGLAAAIKGISLAFTFLSANPLIATITGIALLTTTLIALKHASDVKYIENGFADVTEQLKNSVNNGNDVTKAIKDVATQTGLAVSKVADLAQKAGLVKDATEKTVEALVQLNAETDATKGNTKGILDTNRIIESVLERAVDFQEDISTTVDNIATQYKASKEQITLIGLASKSLTKENKDQLQTIYDQAVQERINNEAKKAYALSQQDIAGKEKAAQKAADDAKDAALKKQQEDYAKVNDVLQKQLILINEQVKASTLINAEDEKKKAFEKAINDLINMGYKVEGANVDTIKGKYEDLLQVIYEKGKEQDIQEAAIKSAGGAEKNRLELEKTAIEIRKKQNEEELDEYLKAEIVRKTITLETNESILNDNTTKTNILIDNKKKELDGNKKIYGDLFALFKENENKKLTSSVLTEDEIALLLKDRTTLTEEESNKVDLIVVKSTNNQKVSIEDLHDAQLSLMKDLMDTTVGIIEDGNKQTASNLINTAGDLAGKYGGMVGGIINMATDIIAAIVEAAEKAKQKALEFENEISDIKVKTIDNEIKANDDLLKSKLDGYEKDKQAALEAAGLADKTESQQIQDKINDLNKQIAIETDATKKSELISQLSDENKAKAKQDIIDIYNQKETDAKEAAAVIDRKLQRDKALLEQSIALNSAKIEKIKAIASLGWFYKKSDKAELESAYTELINSIQALPIPALATGGIVMPQPGGVHTILAENNKPEVVLNLDQLDRMLTQNTGFSNSNNEITHLIVNLNSKPFLDTIFQATRNHTVLIDQGAVV